MWLVIEIEPGGMLRVRSAHEDFDDASQAAAELTEHFGATTFTQQVNGLGFCRVKGPAIPLPDFLGEPDMIEVKAAMGY